MSQYFENKNINRQKEQNLNTKSIELHQDSPKQLESNSGDLDDLQFFPHTLHLNNNSNNNGSENINERNPYTNIKNDEPNNKEVNSQYPTEIDRAIVNSQFSIHSQEDEQIRNEENRNSQFYEPNNRNINYSNNELNYNSSSLIIQDSNNGYLNFNNINNNNSNLNEIEKSYNNDNIYNNINNDNYENNVNNNYKYKKYSLPSSTNENIQNINNPYSNHQSVSNEENNNLPNSSIKRQNEINNDYDNNNYFNNSNKSNDNYMMNNSSINKKDNETQDRKNMISQNSENDSESIYSQPNMKYKFPMYNSKINNSDNGPSNPENIKKCISYSEKKLIKFDNNINLNNQKIIEHVLDKYKKVSKTGLKNLGDSSYLNAVLQSFGQVRHFASYFLNPKYELKGTIIASKPLSYATQRLFKHLYPYPESNTIEIYSPDSYLKILSILKTPYGKQRCNPNDLINFIFYTLHDELNSKKNNDQIIKMPYNYYFSVDNVIQNGINNFTNNNKSKISDVVSWFQLNESNCKNCGKSTFNLNYFNTYDLDIKNTYKHSLKSENNYLRIDDCLSYGAKPKEYNSYCYNCKIRTIKYKQTHIYSPPNVFIFLLDRGIDFDKNTTHIPFKVEEKIDLSNYIIKQNTPKKYRLTGIVSFNLQEQKYVSYCQSPIDNNWYWYNDEKVNLVFCEDILNNKNDNDIPCILYYKPI